MSEQEIQLMVDKLTKAGVSVTIDRNPSKEKLEKLDRINKPKCNLCNGAGFYYEESGDTLKHYECNCQGTKTF